MSNDFEVSKSIGGSLKSVCGHDAKGQWAFEYEKKSNQVSVNVLLDFGNDGDGGGKKFSSDLDATDINELIQWLYTVKTQLLDK